MSQQTIDSSSEIQAPSSLNDMDPNSESQESSDNPGDSSDYFETLNAMDPKARINYELEQLLHHGIGFKVARAGGDNQDCTHEFLLSHDQQVHESIAFIGAHPLFSQIRSEGRPDDCIQKCWASLEKITEGWMGTVRDVDLVDCFIIQIVIGEPKVV